MEILFKLYIPQMDGWMDGLCSDKFINANSNKGILTVFINNFIHEIGFCWLAFKLLALHKYILFSFCLSLNVGS